MAKNIIAQSQPVVNFALADGVCVVILDGEEVAWAGDRATADRSYTEMLRVNGEHLRNPANAIPGAWYTIYTGRFTANVDRTTGEVNYEDAH